MCDTVFAPAILLLLLLLRTDKNLCRCFGAPARRVFPDHLITVVSVEPRGRVQHSGRDADHATSIADHRGSDGRGMSFSKEVLTCARYAKGGSGKVVFVAVGGLRPDWLHDYATQSQGQPGCARRPRRRRPGPAGGALRAGGLGSAVRRERPREAVTWVADLSEWLGDEHAFAGGSKREFASSARRALRDAAARGAAAAEGRDVAWVGGDGPALRMSVDEGETLSTAATAAMARKIENACPGSCPCVGRVGKGARHAAAATAPRPSSCPS